MMGSELAVRYLLKRAGLRRWGRGRKRYQELKINGLKCKTVRGIMFFEKVYVRNVVSASDI